MMTISKKLFLSGSFGILLLFLHVSVSGQAIRNQVEKASDRNQIQNGKETLARDEAELAAFNSDRAALRDAIASRNWQRARTVHQNLVASMEREINQSDDKLKQANREVAGSRGELRSDRREIRSNRAEDARPRQRADDQRDKRDDRRDLRDDKDDRREAQVRLDRQRQILMTYRSIRIDGAGDLADLRAKANLIEEFESSMRADLDETREELGEDRRELREDRRETREDRRQR